MPEELLESFTEASFSSNTLHFPSKLHGFAEKGKYDYPTEPIDHNCGIYIHS
jgi:hypothetical protein